MDMAALNKMKCGKAARPSGIITEMLKAAGAKGIEFLRELITAVVKFGKIPEDWELSFLRGKGMLSTLEITEGSNLLST